MALDQNDLLRAGKLPDDPTEDCEPMAAPDGKAETELDEEIGTPCEEPPEAIGADDAPIAIGCKCTDLGNAERLVARHRTEIRYCPPRRQWLVWDGCRWAWDQRGRIVAIAKGTVRAIYVEAARCRSKEAREAIGTHAHRTERSERIAAMIKLAQSDQSIVVMPNELDAGPWLLNCPNGTIDLRTGALREHRRSDLCTKLTGPAYDGAARHELWERVLGQITGGDQDLGAFLQRLAGYALAGVATEKVFFLLYGPTDTAKSTYVDALLGASGDYGLAVAFSTWCQRQDVGGNRGDLVRLMGARLVASVETGRGKRFDEEVVKAITGGDQIVAAAKYEAEVSFRPQCTLLLAANDSPRIRDDDSGMWSRAVRVPFNHTVQKVDPTVKLRLADPKDAGPAVLAWMVRGCLAWQKDGLTPPKCVQESSAAYRAECDTLREFLEDHVVFEKDATVQPKALRLAYSDWCQTGGVKYPLGKDDFARRIEARGGVPAKSNGRRLWRGVRLRSLQERTAGDSGTEDQRGLWS